ncbi:MAG: hypothetical protein GC185_06890 [Alphaproteobacteria bacterium]|nr:hypothetical protein [Alphaproteobacteria bacterium]
MKHEDGFHFLEYPCKSGKPETLIVLLHGYGNHPEMFKELPEGFQKEFPNADVLIVRGPEPVGASAEHKKDLGVPGVDDLYSWYKVQNDAGKNLELALSHLFNRVPVVDQLNKFADAQLKKRGLKDENLVLYGFSLGGGIVVQMGTRRKEKCAAVICHSGPVFPIIKPKSKPDTMILMGDQDYFFYTRTAQIKNPQGKCPLKAPKRKLRNAFDKAIGEIGVHYDDSKRRLERAGIEATGELVKGMGHTINEESFNKTVKYLAKKLKK